MLIGGMQSLKERYRQEIIKLGAKDCIFHNAVEKINEISGAVSKGDFGLIVTGSAKHAWTNKAEEEFKKQNKIWVRVHQTGVKSVVEAVVNELVPRIKPEF